MSVRASIVGLTLIVCACGPKPSTVKPTVYSNPDNACVDAQQQLIQLAITATGSGPTSEQRQEFMGRCAKATRRGTDCVARLRSVPARLARISCGTTTVCPKSTNKACVRKPCFEKRKVAMLGAVWRCLKKR